MTYTPTSPTFFEMTVVVAQEHTVGFTISCAFLLLMLVLFSCWPLIENRYYLRALKLPPSDVQFYASMIKGGPSSDYDWEWPDHWALVVRIKGEEAKYVGAGDLKAVLAQIKSKGHVVKDEHLLLSDQFSSTS